MQFCYANIFGKLYAKIISMADIVMVHAGFESPANDYREKDIDWNTFLRPHPAATHYGRVNGDCFIEAHIPHNSILVIDRSLTATYNSIIVVVLDGAFYLKRLIKRKGKELLIAANERYKPVEISEEQPLVVWGVVTKVIIDPKESAL